MIHRTLTVVAFGALASCRAASSGNDSMPSEKGSVARVGRLELIARKSLTADSLEVSVVVRNTGRSTDTVSFGACALTVRLYDSANDNLRWDQNRWPGRPVGPNATGHLGRICLMYEVVGTVRPGDTLRAREFTARFAVRSILGDSLPPGTYRLRANLNFNNANAMFDLGDVTLAPARR